MATDTLSLAFAALADPTRRDMVSRLRHGGATVGELAKPYNLTMQAVSKHLNVLEAAGLVSKTREAQRRRIQLEMAAFEQLSEWLEQYRVRAEERYVRLDELLAEIPDEPVNTEEEGDSDA